MKSILMTPLRRVAVVAGLWLWLQAPRGVTASCGLCLHSGEDCPFVYDGFSGLYCGMFTTYSGRVTECCCPNTMFCAATATTCRCSAEPTPIPAPTVAATPAPAPAPTPEEEKSSSATKDIITAVASTVACAVAAAATRYALKRCCRQRERDDDDRDDEPDSRYAKPTSTPGGNATNKVRNGAPQIDLAADAVVQLAQIILTTTAAQRVDENKTRN